MIEETIETTALARPSTVGASKPKKRAGAGNGSGSQAKEAIASAITSTDRTVAELVERAEELAAQKIAAVKEARAQQIGEQIANAQLSAIEDVTNFILGTTGNSQWLLSGASEILDGEVVE